MDEETLLAALAAAKVCHDLSEPVTGLVMGLDSISDADPEARADAATMLQSGVEKLRARLEFFRFAMTGALAGGEGALDEAKPHCTHMIATLPRCELVWSAQGVTLPHTATRAIALMTYVAAKCMPRGGVLEIAAETSGEVRLTARGKGAALAPVVEAALRGERLSDAAIPEYSLPFVAGALARAAGLELSHGAGEDMLAITARAGAIRLAA